MVDNPYGAQMNFWFSAQLRQYRLQFIRAFSGFYVRNGAGELSRVPCRYGDSSRIAASIIIGNSENKVLTVPFISCYVSTLGMSAERRMDPQLVHSVSINERKYDEERGRYTNELGNRVTVDRYMPVPYNLTMQVDIWTSSLDTKEQLLEQILVLYNPSVDVQTSVNPIDWTVLSYIEMQDNINWSSRSIPIGTDNPIDVATLMFKIPIWINAPAMVKKQSIIEQIITNIVEGKRDPGTMEWTEYEFLSRTITTPGDATIRVSPLSNGSYVFELCDSSGGNTDHANLPTVVTAKIHPNLSRQLSFRWNGKICNVNSSTIEGAISDIRSSLTGTNLNCVIYNNTTMQFINTSGGDNTFEDISFGSLDALGLQEGVYEGGKLAWWRLLQLYGNLKSLEDYGMNSSQIRLKTVDDIEKTETDIVGWISFDITDQNKLIWTPDSQSFPTATLDPISAIIDPSTSGPNVNLPAPAIGQRYLIIEDAPSSSMSWGTLNAKTNDIIEFNGASWQVKYDAANNSTATDYVLNTRTNLVYKWENSVWAPVIEKRYAQGYWRLAI